MTLPVHNRARLQRWALSTLFTALSTAAVAAPVTYGNITLDASYALDGGSTVDGMSSPSGIVYTTADGADLRVTAEAATPETPGPDTTAGTGAAARKVLGILTTPDGIRTDLRSLAAQMDVTGDSVTFAGGVDLDNGGGYRVQTDSMVARMDMTEVRSLAPVTATGPGTRITAREMVLTQDPTRPDSYVLVFTGQVKLVYDPPK